MEEYKEIINNAFPSYIIDSVYDYGDILVFNLIPNDYVIKHQDEGPLNRSFSINKTTKEIKAFFPFDIPLDQYRSGKKII